MSLFGNLRNPTVPGFTSCTSQKELLYRATRKKILMEYYLENVDHEYASIKSDDFVGAINKYATEKKIDLLTLLLRDHGNNSLPSRGEFVQELLTRTQLPILTLV